MPTAGSSLLRLLPAALLLAAVVPAPSSAARPLDPGSTFTSGLDLERLPEGGFLAVWQRDATEHLPFGPDTCVHREAVAAQFDDAGIPVEGPQPLTFEGETENPSALHVAAAPLRSAWFPVVAYTTAAGLKVADLSGFTVRSPTLVSSCSVHHFDLLASGLDIVLVWSESCDGHRIRARPIDLDGRPRGPAVTLVEERLAGPAHAFAAILSPLDGLFVAWVERESEDFGDGRRVVAARFRTDGSRETPVRTVSGLLLSSSSPEDSIAVARVVASATPVFDYRMVVSWRDEEGAIRLRSFSTDLEPLVEIPVAAGAGARGTGQILDASSFGSLVVAWESSGDGTSVPACPLRAFDSDLQPLGAPVGLGTDCDAPADLAFVDLTTTPLAAWQVSDLPVSVCARTEIAVVHPPGLEPAPQGPPIESPEFPGFVFNVRIGGDEPAPRVGTEEPDCLPETVCVSGALPGRTELLMRIVGPKPNGFLWPTLVRFTTSQVEVWIRQVSTGEMRYYRLDGSTPGSEELDGLFDRDGFPPT